MRYATFLLWNAIGGITWATAYILIGYLAGSAWQRVEHYTSVVSYSLFGAIIVIIAAIIFIKRRRQRDRDKETLQELAGEPAEESAAEPAEQKQNSDV
jgi:membrane protein DedA with SNARE-associated domain